MFQGAATRIKEKTNFVARRVQLGIKVQRNSTASSVPFIIPTLATHATDNLECKNTGQDIEMLADDNGRLCTVHELDPHRAGCCRDESPKHVCSGCEQNCCSTFEMCTSCCTGKYDNVSAVQQQITHNKHLYNDLDSVFAACMAVCRTNAKSTVHENAYVSPSHRFCYAGKL